MRRNSHIQLGRFLARNCMHSVPKRCVYAFRFGCIEPDMNPATYLKGSRHIRFLRGHNFNNSEKYMKRISDRLEKRGVNSVFSFYRMGRLVHYITDGFTFAHNENFDGNLREHSAYEHGLHEMFPDYLSRWGDSLLAKRRRGSAFGVIQRQHREYMRQPSGMSRDCRFAILTALSVVSIIMESSAGAAL